MAPPLPGERPIIIKKIKKVSGHGHHGGAWKVAYADFVTAMMAFFLMLWLLSNASKEQKEGIANYFAPSNISSSTSGAGGILAGRSLDSEGAMRSPVVPMLAPAQTDPGVQTEESKEDADTTGATFDKAKQEEQERLRQQDEKNFDKMEQNIKAAIAQDAELAGMAENLLLEKTSEGLRIHLIDQEKRPLFASGSKEPMDYTRKLLVKVAGIVRSVPNRLAISGHTDSAAFNKARSDYSNWELSSDRANTARRVLRGGGVREGRIASVEGRADRDPLLRDNPASPANRRISVTLLYRHPGDPAEAPTSPIENGVFQ